MLHEAERLVGGDGGGGVTQEVPFHVSSEWYSSVSDAEVEPQEIVAVQDVPFVTLFDPAWSLLGMKLQAGDPL